MIVFLCNKKRRQHKLLPRDQQLAHLELQCCQTPTQNCCLSQSCYVALRSRNLFKKKLRLHFQTLQLMTGLTISVKHPSVGLLLRGKNGRLSETLHERVA